MKQAGKVWPVYLTALLIMTLGRFVAESVIFGPPSQPSERGLSIVFADYFGLAIAVVALGSLGLFYKPNRRAGLVVGICAAGLLVLIGQR